MCRRRTADAHRALAGGEVGSCDRSPFSRMTKVSRPNRVRGTADIVVAQSAEFATIPIVLAC